MVVNAPKLVASGPRRRSRKQPLGMIMPLPVAYMLLELFRNKE
jgi:hypothetical protein